MELPRPLLEPQQSSAYADLHEAASQSAAEITLHEDDGRRTERAILHRLLSKLSVLEKLSDEVSETRRQMEEMETEDLETHLMLDPTDPQPTHVTAQLANGIELLAMMSRMQHELEGRLDNMLSRIAMETQEIKELEQQLTDGQILANEALQKDLEGIISGLQEYLRGLGDKARCAQQQADSLQTENQALQRHLEDLQGQMEDAARIHTQDMVVQQEEVSFLRQEVEALRERQVHSSRQEAELDAELHHLREELNQQVTLGQEEKASLLQTVETLQNQLDRAKDQLHQNRTQHKETRTQLKQTRSQLDQTRSQVDQVTAAMLDSDEAGVTTGEKNSRSISPDQDRTRTGREQAQVVQDQESEWRLEELQRLQVKLQRTRSRNRHVQRSLEAELKQSRLQLRDVQQERDVLLLQLQTQNDDHQRKLRHANRKLNQLPRGVSESEQLPRGVSESDLLPRGVSESEQLARDQLRSTADRLRALNAAMDLLDARQHQKTEADDGSFLQTKRRSDRRRGNTPTVEELRAELAAAQRLTLRLTQQLDHFRTRTTAGPCAGAQWVVFPPGHSGPCLGSRDSGLGLQHLSPPQRGRQEDRPPTGGGNQDHKPPTHISCETGAAEDRRDSGSRPLTPPPAGLCDTPPSGAAWLLCGSPLTNVYLPTAGGAALYCNVPEHKDVAERSVHECVHEHVHREAERLEKENKKLRLENKQLQHTLRRHRSVLLVCEEVECVEKTLLRRRAELRQADRRLLEAQRCFHTELHKSVPPPLQTPHRSQRHPDGAK